MENSKINENKTKEQFAIHMFRDLQQQHIMNSYHSIPTDFISNWQWMEVNAICFPMYWQGRLGHDAGQLNKI
jgi:hypothetical protein